MHLNGNIFGKDDFVKTVEAKVIIITRYVQSNETMTINKFQRSRLTFQPNCYGHMTKIADIPIYDINPLKIFSRTKRMMTLGLGM